MLPGNAAPVFGSITGTSFPPDKVWEKLPARCSAVGMVSYCKALVDFCGRNSWFQKKNNWLRSFDNLPGSQTAGPILDFGPGDDAAHETIAALQAKIQEMVLENTLVERNGPVPPQYKNLVDDYYRVLSQDLR